MSEKERNRVKALIKKGQLEITQGGWTASDEATPNYQDLILNMHMGHRFLQEEFGVKPKIGWMLDAFGHSQANAQLFAEFGFEALFFSRMSQDERLKLQETKRSIFLWEPLSNLFGSTKQILTQVFFWDYSPPPTFANEHNGED